MVRIGLLSDTHGHWDPRYEEYFSTCDQIWHAGDIGSVEVFDNLCEIKPTRAVLGNIDGGTLQTLLKKVARFKVEGVDVLLTHIGGTPGNYDAAIKSEIINNPPMLFICGHSHILKVAPDKKFNMLYVNPGAAGVYGSQQVRTLVRFALDKGNITEFEVIELR